MAQLGGSKPFTQDAQFALPPDEAGLGYSSSRLDHLAKECPLAPEDRPWSL